MSSFSSFVTLASIKQLKGLLPGRDDGQLFGWRRQQLIHSVNQGLVEVFRHARLVDSTSDTLVTMRRTRVTRKPSPHEQKHPAKIMKPTETDAANIENGQACEHCATVSKILATKDQNESVLMLPRTYLSKPN